MIAHIIIDPNRPRPNTTLEGELDWQHIREYLWEAIADPQGVVRSINLSHKQIVEYAKKCNLPEICIMEEDVMFIAEDGWQYFLDNKPKSFDLYLGGAYALSHLEFTLISEGNGPVKVKSFTGLHCYIISAGYYDTFLAMPEDRHIDDQAAMGQFYVCAPMPALQHPGWSSNARRTVDYNCDPRILPPNAIYYGKTKK